MRAALKATLMLLGAACVLLFAGGFPRLGAPELYRGGAMLMLGVLGAVVSLWGAWVLSRGKRWQLLFGMVFLFFVLVGATMLYEYGTRALELAQQGGAMWAGAFGLGCWSLVGVIFMGVFGYLATRLMTHRLWLAGVHVCVVMVALGAYLDFCGEETAMLNLPANGTVTASSVTTADGRKLDLDFSICVKEFEITHYESDHYTIRTSRNGAWVDPQPLTLRDGVLHGAGSEDRWPLSALQTAPGIERPFLLLQGEPLRLIVQEPPTVQEYVATCSLTQQHRGMNETTVEKLRVNEPIERKGWLLTLVSHQPMGRTQLVIMQARRAPGRIWALAGLAGLVICTCFWCWGKKEDEAV